MLHKNPQLLWLGLTTKLLRPKWIKLLLLPHKYALLQLATHSDLCVTILVISGKSCKSSKYTASEK